MVGEKVSNGYGVFVDNVWNWTRVETKENVKEETVLTSVEIDITGLSYTTVKPIDGPYTKTTVEQINTTEKLIA